jgi:dTDP-4-amino-4,6-dideoxygalactose transaminase
MSVRAITEVPLLDLKAQYATIRGEVEAQIAEVLSAQYFILGPKVQELEEKIAAMVGVKHAIGVASCSDALLLAMMALGVGPGDSVISTAFSFIASTGCVSRVGGRPLFCDIEPGTYNLDAAAVAKLLAEECEQTAAGLRHRPTGTRVRAIVPVHLYGQCADMTTFGELGLQYGLPLVEDAAQAIGATHRGKQAGSLGALGCFSFFPSKNLGAYGDGGMVVTDDDSLAKTVRILRVHGASPKYFNIMVGANSRLDALQAAILLAKLPHLAEWAAARRQRAAYYDRALADVPEVMPLVVRPENECVYHQYVVRVARRDELMAFLKERRIGTAIYYPHPLHLQQCYADLGAKEGDCPEAEAAAQQTIALPMFPELAEPQQDYVVAALRSFFARSR